MPSLNGSATRADSFEDLMLAWDLNEPSQGSEESGSEPVTEPKVTPASASPESSEIGEPIASAERGVGSDEGRHEPAVSPAISAEQAVPPASEKVAVPIPAVPDATRALAVELQPVIEAALPSLDFGSLDRNPEGHKKSELEPPFVNEHIRSSSAPVSPVRNSREHFKEELAGAQAVAAEPSAVRRPSTPPLTAAPNPARLVEYSPLAGRPLRPAPPRWNIIKKEIAPRTTLPGPALVKQLVVFDDPKLAPIPTGIRRRFEKRGMPGWLITVMILGTLLGAGFSSFFTITPRSNAEASASAPSTASTSSESATPELVSRPAPTALSKAIEVTGFRIVVDPSHKSQIEYLVVNHSPNEFSGVTVYVTLRPSDAKPGQPPLCRFSFTAPNLGPFESRELTSMIEKVNRPLTLPDWQDLRADLEIGQ